MRSIPRIGRIVIGVAVAATTSVGLAGQTQGDLTSAANALDMLREQERIVRQYAAQLQAQPTGPVQPGGDPFEGPVVVDAPFMGEAHTTVTQTLGDGTRIEQTATTKFYRDRAGRVRREQSIIGLGPSPGPATPTVISIDPDPGDAFAFTLDPAARTARRVPRIRVGLYMAGGNSVSLNTAGTPFTVGGIVQPAATAPGGRGGRGAPQSTNARTESLGTRQIEGVTATGQRTTRTIPTGQIGNDRPIEIVDERWESPELKLLIQSRFSDPRTGVVEYRLTSISRIDPAPDLFMVPTDYTVIEPPAGGRGGGPGPGGRGAGGGARGRGQQ